MSNKTLKSQIEILSKELKKVKSENTVKSDFPKIKRGFKYRPQGEF